MADPTYLTAEGRRLLEERLHTLRDRLAELDAAFEDDRGEDVARARVQVADELAAVEAVLARAVDVEHVPDDPDVVEVGDAVAIRLEDGSEERYVLVSATEAIVDDERISLESPLAKALIGHRVGDEVDVAVPGGSYRCTILSASRA